jgi:glycosyltransferase involved in cell wall biosynthesis
MKLSVLVPVYNEEKTVVEVVKRVLAVKITGIEKEIIVINDGSTDNTPKLLKKIKDKRVKIFNQKINTGKGAAIKEGLKLAKGQLIIIQDADLEYDPQEFELLLSPIREGIADVVYGSRFITFRPHRILYFWHMVGNKILTLLVNAITNMNFTDMETCYKAFTREVANKLVLEENRFGFEPEFTIKVARLGFRIYEVGVSYSGRDYREGKKINWKDGVRALWCVIKYGLV